MKCVVCKSAKEKGTGRQQWAFTSQRTPMGHIQIIFKLFELTKSEFSAGSVCPVCYELVAQIDSLEYQMLDINKSLRSRINCCATEEDYAAAHCNDDDLFVEEQQQDRDRVQQDEDMPLAATGRRGRGRKKRLRLGEDDPYEAEQTVQSNATMRQFRKRRRANAANAAADASSAELASRVKKEILDGVDHDDDEEDVCDSDTLLLASNRNELEDEDDEDVDEPSRGAAFDEDDGDDTFDVNQFLSVQPIKTERDESAAYQALPPAAHHAAAERKPRPPPREPNRSADNLDFNLTITRTTRGHDQLVYENYTYLKTPHQPQGDIAKWKCTSYYATKTGCKSKLHTTLDGLCVLLDSKTEHNHPPPDERQLKIILFREQVKQIANNHPDMKPSDILASAQMLLDTPTSLGLKDESIMRYIQRVRSKSKIAHAQQQQLPQQQEQEQEQQEQQQKHEQVNNVIHEDEEESASMSREPERLAALPLANDTDVNVHLHQYNQPTVVTSAARSSEEHGVKMSHSNSTYLSHQTKHDISPETGTRPLSIVPFS